MFAPFEFMLIVQLHYHELGMPWWQALVMAAYVCGVDLGLIRDPFECGLV